MASEITQASVRALASEEAFSRGVGYYEQGAVHGMVRRGSVLEARVLGGEPSPYRVEIDLDRPDRATCSCPYEWGGACKHIVAVLLAYLEDPEDLEERPAPEALIGSLDRDRLASVLTALLERHPDLLSEVEILLSPTEDAEAGDAALPSPNMGAIEERVRRIFDPAPRRSPRGRRGYEREDSDPSSEDVRELLRLTEPYLERGDGRSALAILKTFTGDLADAIVEQLESGYEETDLDGAFEEAGRLWTEAVLSADLSASERAEHAKSLRKWDEEASDYGYEALGAARLALEQGWDDPGVKRRLQGEAASEEEDEEDLWAKEVAQVRLKILERQGRREEYLNLARAEGLTERYLTMLVRSDRIEEALERGRELTKASDALALAKALSEKGRTEDALGVAERFLAKREGEEASSEYYGPSGREDLAVWLRDAATEAGRRERALSAAVLAFKARIRFSHYLAARRLAEDEWPEIREELLDLVRRSDSHYPMEEVSVLLEEGLADDAIRKVKIDGSHALVERVADATLLTHPDWVFEACAAQFDRIADAGKADYYQEAAGWLKKARESLLHAGREEDWERYLDRMLERHRRKYKLVPMLRNLR
jgi:uncharacterized Zn finger protein